MFSKNGSITVDVLDPDFMVENEKHINSPF